MFGLNSLFKDESLEIVGWDSRENVAKHFQSTWQCCCGNGVVLLGALPVDSDAESIHLSSSRCTLHIYGKFVCS